MIAHASKPSKPTSFSGARSLSIGSEMDFSLSIYLPQDPKDQEGVELLLGISNIVSNEIANSKKKIFDDDDDINDEQPSVIFDDPVTPKDDMLFSWNRARTVSIDNGQGQGYPPRNTDHEKTMEPIKSLRLPAIVSPVGTRGLRTIRKPSLKLLANKRERITKLKQTQSNQTVPNAMSEHKRKATEQRVIKGIPVTIIHRKKFSWKNYPELEAFLVCNREEYLRHSALNYTIQQKRYNNRLTERLLDLAANNIYVFNENEFSFVTVRDRIRCFYKSYVQSSKKRGIVLGYAARKAGILSPADLQRSARKEGTIVTPVEL
mmetsp:Transcript_28482/g.32643  ORF Transcript_28482/g.32643 Transcript_28482/m.32643 type:complete len:319 (-) Transcript_28482:405-1361(-)